MPTAEAMRVGDVVCISHVSHIANYDASTLFRILPACHSQALTHNANMKQSQRLERQEINGGPNYTSLWRESAGLEGVELAKQMGTSAGHLSDLEKGKRGLTPPISE